MLSANRVGGGLSGWMAAPCSVCAAPSAHRASLHPKMYMAAHGELPKASSTVLAQPACGLPCPVLVCKT